MHKLEQPARVAELSPQATLGRLGLKDGMTFADIGAGTGIFAFAAPALTSGVIYAVDSSIQMRSVLAERKDANGAGQVTILSDVADIPKETVDLALLCTVLHEIEQKGAFLRDIVRALKPEGRLAVIEFHKARTPLGPPPTSRLDVEEVTRLAESEGLSEIERFSLGENFYCVCFRAAEKEN